MDWFKKQKWSNWIIGVLVVFNVLTLATLWSLRMDRPEGMPRPPEEGPMRDRMVMGLLRDELALSDEQVEKLRDMRTRHFEGFGRFGDQTMTLRREIMDALFAETPDTLRVHELAGQIGRLYTERELQNAIHFQHLYEICTPEQRARFKTLFQEILPEPRKGGGPGPGWRAQGEERHPRGPGRPDRRGAGRGRPPEPGSWP